MSARVSPDAFAVLQWVRVKGTVARGSDPSIPAADAVIEQGLVAARAARGEEYLMLTDAGKEAHAEVLAELREAPGFAALAPAYDADFLPLNVRFKDLAAQWQLTEDRWPLLEPLLEVDDEIVVFLEVARGASPHFGRYEDGLRAAMDAVQDGDADALTAAIGPSYHNLWFELHEDLLTILGRSRADEEA